MFEVLQCEVTKNWYCVGASGYKYWGSTAREAKQKAQLYFYK